MKGLLKSSLASLIILFLVLSLSGCGSKAVAKADKVVRIGQPIAGEKLYALAGIAQEKGFFEEELAKVGFRPEYYGFAGAGSEINEALATGNLDFAINLGATPPISASSNNIGVKAIALTDSDNTMAYIAHKEDDSINSVKDFEGKTVIVMKGTIYHLLFSQILEKYELEEGRIEVLNAVADASSLFQSGEADVWGTSPLNAVLLEDSGEAKVIFTTEDTPELSSQLWLVGKSEFVETHPDAAVAIIKAYIRAWQYAVENPEEAYEIMIIDGTYTVDQVKRVYSELNGENGTFEFGKGDMAEADIEKLQTVSDFLYEKKLIENKVNVRDFIDTQYYEQAIAEMEEM